MKKNTKNNQIQNETEEDISISKKIKELLAISNRKEELNKHITFGDFLMKLFLYSAVIIFVIYFIIFYFD